MNILLLLIMVVFGIAAILTLIRIVRGPSILDRAVASDVLLTEVMCVLGAEMAINGHTRNIPVLLIIARDRGVRLDLRRPVRREKGQHDLMNILGLVIPDPVIDVAVLVLILLGALLCLSAAVGLLRFRDVPSRLHAATKPQVLGLLLICIAIALSQRSIGGILLGFVLVAPVVLMQFATAPLSAHMVGRQAYRNGTIEQRGLVVDELAESKQTPPAAG